MNLHEYQAKELLSDYGVPIPKGAIARTPADAESAATHIGGENWIVKAQIHAGGRGKAGGIKRAGSATDVRSVADALLGSTLVTAQTGTAGKRVNQVYVEAACQIEQEIYLAVLIDRSTAKIAFLGSSSGGEDIEEMAAEDPNKIHKLVVDDVDKLDSEALNQFIAGLGFSGNSAIEAVSIAQSLFNAFRDFDASLIEINPLALAKDGSLLAIDAKMIVDDNALFRHGDLEQLRDESEEDQGELEARRYELNFASLGGNVGCVVNGAGLALATLDLLIDNGVAPANFMDIRPVATREQVATGFEMVLGDANVEAVLVNIYGGGILRCDTIAEGIAIAVQRKGLNVPLIVRAGGTNMELCHKVLTSQGIATQFARDMTHAVELVKAATSKETA